MDNIEKKYPRVGIGAIIENENGEVLMGLRKGSHGAGEWCCPGGGLEFGETIFECTKREIMEEAGLELDEFELISVSDEMKYIESDGKHYLQVGVKAKYNGGEPKVMEPDKCEKWEWFSLENLPENILEGTDMMIRKYISGRVY